MDWVVVKRLKFSLCGFLFLVELQRQIRKYVYYQICTHEPVKCSYSLFFPASAVFGTFQQNQVHAPSSDCTDHLYQERGNGQSDMCIQMLFFHVKVFIVVEGTCCFLFFLIGCYLLSVYGCVFYLFRPARCAKPKSWWLRQLTSYQLSIPVFSTASNHRMTPLKEVKLITLSSWTKRTTNTC